MKLDGAVLRQEQIASRKAMYVNSSSVAAAIGMHPFKSAEEAFYEILMYSPQWKGVVEAVKARTRAKTSGEAFAAAVVSAPELGHAIEAGVAEATAASSDAAVSAAIATAVRKGVAASAGAGLDAAVVEAGVVQAVQTMRGHALEAVALDAFEATSGTVVKQRNAKMMYLRTANYVIGGRIDGFDEEARRVVEVKNRRRMWASPPTYDLIQLRVYLKMMSSTCPDVSGVLLERFPDGSSKETAVANTEEDWAPIHKGLLAVKRRFEAVTEEEVERVVAAVCGS